MEFDDSIFDHPLTEMMEAGRFDTYRICVYGGEGPIPHFHFYKTTDDSSGGCIRLDKPEYFDHGHHQAKMNSTIKNRAIEWLKSTPKTRFGHFTNNWEAMCYMWDIGNPTHPTDPQLEMPDYTKL